MGRLSSGVPLEPSEVGLVKPRLVDVDDSVVVFQGLKKLLGVHASQREVSLLIPMEATRSNLDEFHVEGLAKNLADQILLNINLLFLR